MQRYSNIELLRIISMILIVFHHFAVHSHFIFATDTITFNRLFDQFTIFGGKLGVDCFVLISGYFLIKKEFSLYKFLKLLCITWFYSAIIAMLALYNGIQVQNVIEYFIPIYSSHWFAYVYLLLYIFSPFINKMLLAMDRTLHFKLILLMTLLWCILKWSFEAPLQYNNFMWFIYMYIVGAYIRLYDIQGKNNGRNILLALGCYMLLVVVYDVIGFYDVDRMKCWVNFYAQNSPIILIMAVSMFLYFKNLCVGHIGWINVVASTTFGIYLIHDHRIVRNLLWTGWLDNPAKSANEWLWLYGILEVASIFVICMIIELIRKKITVIVVPKWIKNYIDNLQILINEKLTR